MINRIKVFTMQLVIKVSVLIGCIVVAGTLKGLTHYTMYKMFY